MAIIDRDQRGELRTGGMAHDEKTLGITSVLDDMVMNPADGPGDVAHDRRHVDAREESVVGGDKYESLVYENLRLDLDAGLVARLPTAAVNPEDHRQVLRITWRINIEHLARVRRIGVGDVAFDVLSPRFGQDRESEEQRGELFHGLHPCRRSSEHQPEG